VSTPIFNYCYWEFWAPYDPPNEYFGNQKVTFDGENRLIIVNDGVTYLRVKEDIYSNWKEWVQVRKNSEWYEALRTTGGDPVGGGLYSGDIYFTINDWKIVINEQVTVEGIIYDETPGVSPFIVNPGGGVRNIVSNLALQYTTTPGGDCPTVEEIRIEMDTHSVKLADIDTKVTALPTSAEIAQDVWNYSVRELTDSMTPEEFWNFLLSTPMAPGSAGEKLKQVLTTGNFLALK
jgi:hypothetical protein